MLACRYGECSYSDDARSFLRFPPPMRRSYRLFAFLPDCLPYLLFSRKPFGGFPVREFSQFFPPRDLLLTFWIFLGSTRRSPGSLCPLDSCPHSYCVSRMGAPPILLICCWTGLGLFRAFLALYDFLPVTLRGSPLEFNSISMAWRASFVFHSFFPGPLNSCGQFFPYFFLVLFLPFLVIPATR